MARLNSLYLHVEREALENDVNVPQHPVEKGIKLSDHIERLPQSLSLSGKILRKTGSEVNSAIASIINLEKSGKIATYTGRKVYYNMVVTNFSYNADANIANGFNFTMTLQEIRIAGQSYKTGAKSAKSESTSGLKQTQNQNTGSQTHTIKKGDTLWALAPKYGTTWQNLQKINGNIDPTKLQIGQKIRVK
ncbi:phage baseplate protein [Lederbergia citrisecunda]|uniref:LysM peptidoglycan-binding domain-containing protein n=1 Tax=Lederbergia citrisecunda TaxID=2833583 RepID=UPI003D2D748E